MIWLSAFSYATDDALMNCGARTLVSNVQRLRAFAGSWMSRTTTVGSPVTVPIAMLSPAGTVPTQWTRVAGRAPPPAVGGGGGVGGGRGGGRRASRIAVCGGGCVWGRGA